MKTKRNERGFRHGTFKDRNGEICSIQKSSIATEDCIWLGVDDAKPRRLIPGLSWQPVPFPEGTLFTTRMHLNREQVKELLPILELFAKTGRLE